MLVSLHLLSIAFLYLYLSSSHTVKKIFLGPDSSQEPSIHKPSSPGASVIRQEWWQRSSTKHERGTTPLQFNLSEETWNLHAVDRRSLGSRLNHQLKIVVRESLEKTKGNTCLVDKVLVVVCFLFHAQVKLFHVTSIFIMVSLLQLLF